MEFIPTIERLTQIFSNAVAPSFFLGAVAAFVSLMMSRLAAVNERIKATRALSDQDGAAVGSTAGEADIGLDRVEVWNDPKRQGHLGSSYSAKARQDVQSDCYGLYNWGGQ